MTRPIRSLILGIKPKVNTDLYSSLEYDLDSAWNSVGLVQPLLLESFFQDTRMALLELSSQENMPIALKTSSKTFIVRRNEEPKLEAKAFPNGARAFENSAVNPEKDINSKDNVAEKTVNNKKNEVLSTRVLRSAGKYAEFNRELKTSKDFSIENIDWYYEDENYYKKKLQVVLSVFTIPKKNRREGNQKLSYTYFLLDSRKYKNKANIGWLDFIEAIFYIGKGKSGRALKHAKEAEIASTPVIKNCRKIREIWNSGNPINAFLVTENIVAEEAFTREAAMIEAIGLKRLCNRIHGSYYGVAATMKARERLELGATLLMEARNIFRWKKIVDIYPKEKTVVASFAKPKELSDPKESPKNEEAKNRASPNITKNTKNVGSLVDEKKQLSISLVKEKSSIATYTKTNSKTVVNNSAPRKVIITETKTDKTEKQTTLEAKNITVKTVTKNELLPTHHFSLKNMDWYYENENDYKKELTDVLSDFAIPKNNRRKGNEKLYYNFLLLDSRWCKDKASISWLDFIEAIFYIGKGKHDRAVKLVEEAERASNTTHSTKLFIKIKDIWNSGNSVKVFLVSESIIAEEAFTRSAAMIDAMSLNRLCNERRGSYYEKAKTMKTKECFKLGATLLTEARDTLRWKKLLTCTRKKKQLSTR